MVDATEGDGEFIADLATEGAWLSEPQVVGIGGLPAAYQTGLRGHIRQVFLVALAPGPPQARTAAPLPFPALRSRVRVGVILGVGGSGAQPSIAVSALQGRYLQLERLLNGAGVLGRERVLLGQNCDEPRLSGPH